MPVSTIDLDFRVLLLLWWRPWSTEGALLLAVVMSLAIIIVVVVIIAESSVYNIAHLVQDIDLFFVIKNGHNDIEY